VLVLSAVTVPTAAILCISAVNTITTSISIKFNLGDRKSKISYNIKKFNIIKDKLEYVISCNGNLSKDESEFRKLLMIILIINNNNKWWIIGEDLFGQMCQVPTLTITLINMAIRYLVQLICTVMQL